MYEGKMYSITVKHKPTQKEAVQLLAEKFNGVMTERTQKTFRNIAGEYIESRSNVLSPRSIREYKLYVDRLPSWFTAARASEISQSNIQQCINELAKDKAPKTVRSLHGFISAVMGHYNPNMKLNTALPQRIKKEPYIPSSDDVKRILEYTKEKSPMFYVPIALASSCGMRRSEILALKIEDIKNGEIHIHSALVEDENNEWVEKPQRHILPQEPFRLSLTLKSAYESRDMFIRVERSPYQIICHGQKRNWEYRSFHFTSFDISSQANF